MCFRPTRSILAFDSAEYFGRRAVVRYSRSLVARSIGSSLAEAEKVAEQAAIAIKGPVFHRRDIGTPASYGCIRMKSSDVASLYERLPLGALVQIVPDKLPRLPKAPKNPAPVIAAPSAPAAPPTKSASAPLVVASGRGA